MSFLLLSVDNIIAIDDEVLELHELQGRFVTDFYRAVFAWATEAYKGNLSWSWIAFRATELSALSADH